MKKISLGILLIPLFVFLSPPSLAKQTSAQNENKRQVTATPSEVTEEQENLSHGASRSAERKSEVAKAVEQLLSAADRSGGIGPEIREIARAQNQGQEEAEEALNQSQTRGSWKKLLLGPDYQALKEAKKEVAQMQVRIRKLEQIQARLTNQAAIQQIQEAIQNLQEQRTALLQDIDLEENKLSLFGWLRKLFNQRE